jgi:hypothetical protein
MRALRAIFFLKNKSAWTLYAAPIMCLGPFVQAAPFLVLFVPTDQSKYNL